MLMMIIEYGTYLKRGKKTYFAGYSVFPDNQKDKCNGKMAASLCPYNFHKHRGNENKVLLLEKEDTTFVHTQYVVLCRIS